MLRSLSPLTDGEFDVLVIGGGAFGAAAAHDAAQRGLRTALIERSDFGSGASAECFKMVHGGIRYLQHADVRRLRASCAERSALLRIAPHLVHPLPIAIPTYGRGRRGKTFLRAGTLAYDLFTCDRNAGIGDPARRIDNCHTLSRGEVLELFPDIQTRHLTGAVVFADGQMYNPARLVLAFVKSAAAAGATVCNYLEATDFLWNGTAAVRGVRVRDRIDGHSSDIRARLVLNAAGPWASYLNDHSPSLQSGTKRGVYSRDAFVTLARVPTSKYGLALEGHSRDSDARFSRGARHLFMVPWRDFTLLGVWHRVFADRPDTARVAPDEVRAWLDELNSIYPALNVSPQDVSFANCGLVPFGDKALAGEQHSFGKESTFIDHRTAHGVQNLVTVIGIRFTMARSDAAQALDLLLQQMPSAPARAPTDKIPLAGGTIERFEDFSTLARRTYAGPLTAEELNGVLRNYGTDYGEALAQGAVNYSVKQEWAVRLEDVVLRRTDLGSGRHPGRSVLEETAARMGPLLGWSLQRRNAELADCERTLKSHWAFDVARKPVRAIS